MEGIFVAVAQDGNSRIYLVAFNITDFENDASQE